MHAFQPDAVFVDGAFCAGVCLLLDDDGTFVAVGPAPADAVHHRLPGAVIMPGFVNAHSHAFQRALRGRTEAAAPGASFWSWRDDMYALVAALDPDSMRIVAQQAFAEMVSAGYTRVKEFHYVHHARDGAPYDDPNAMVHALVAAAEPTGIALEVLRVVYLETTEAAQARFCDGDVDTAMARTDALRAAVTIPVGVAPHSVRAVHPDAIATIAAWARSQDVECHSHVAEQPAEVAWSVDTFGARPVQALADRGVLGPGFTGVHLTHLTASEVVQVGRSGATACICPTTEANLGDGLPDSEGLLAAGARLAIGTDSQAEIDPFVELRLLEYNERNRLGRRRVLEPARLLSQTTERWVVGAVPGFLVVDRAHPGLLGVGLDHLAGALVMGANAGCVSEVHRGLRRLEPEAPTHYASTVQELFS